MDRMVWGPFMPVACFGFAAVWVSILTLLMMMMLSVRITVFLFI